MWGFIDDIADEAGDYDKPDGAGDRAWRFDDGLADEAGNDDEVDGAGDSMLKPTNRVACMLIVQSAKIISGLAGRVNLFISLSSEKVDRPSEP